MTISVAIAQANFNAVSQKSGSSFAIRDCAPRQNRRGIQYVFCCFHCVTRTNATRTKGLHPGIPVRNRVFPLLHKTLFVAHFAYSQSIPTPHWFAASKTDLGTPLQESLSQKGKSHRLISQVPRNHERKSNPTEKIPVWSKKRTGLRSGI